jgi:hypothetical protein
VTQEVVFQCYITQVANRSPALWLVTQYTDCTSYGRTKILNNEQLFALSLSLSKVTATDWQSRLYFNKIATFRKLDLLPSSGKKERTNPSCWAPWMS